MAKQIKLQYQVKYIEYAIYNLQKISWEMKELIYPCNPNKSDRENFDDAYSKACELGCDPRKNIEVKFIEE